MSLADATLPEFGKWRTFFWPIHSHELKKLIPMFLMFFFISLVYGVLRGNKDSFMITAPGSGADAIPFLKVGGVVPMAFIFMLIYAKLSNILSKEKLFFTTVTFFLVFFFLYATILYPWRDYLHPNEFADRLQAALPKGLGGLVASIRNWTFALFYIFAELWGSFILSLLFWGFANDITKVHEAKRFYALFGLGANLALVCSGLINHYILSLQEGARLSGEPGLDEDFWKTSIYYIMGICIFSGIIVMFIYNWITKNVLTDPFFYSQTERKKVAKEKPKMSLKDSFRFLAHSPYILCIAILVISYNVVINLVEVTWKGQLHMLYHDTSAYAHYQNTVNIAIGLTSSFMMIFVSNNILRRFGWATTAYITPIAILITGIAFFLFIIFQEPLTPWLTTLGLVPLVVGVLFGTIQNVISKASKYTLFDPTKEMAYIPLDQESKVKGKAAIDTVGARLGKAGGSGIQIMLIAIFGSLAAITPIIAVIMIAIIAAWLWAINKLDKTEFTPIEHPKAKK